MKTRKPLLLILCLLLAMLALSGCINEQDNARMEAECRTVLNALITNDPEAGWRVFAEGELTREEYDAFFARCAPQLEGIAPYTLKQNGWSSSFYDGIRTNEITYGIFTDDELFALISVTEIEGVEGLTDIRVQIVPPSTPNSVGSFLAAFFAALLAVWLVHAGILLLVMLPIGLIVLRIFRKREAKRKGE